MCYEAQLAPELVACCPRVYLFNIFMFNNQYCLFASLSVGLSICLFCTFVWFVGLFYTFIGRHGTEELQAGARR